MRDRSIVIIGGLTQVAASGLSLLFSPYVLKAIGPEAYGLVGIFLIAFAWFSLLDAGLTPALLRETARFRGNAVSLTQYAHTYRGLELLIILCAIPIALVFWSGAGYVAEHWVQTEKLVTKTVEISLYLMGGILLLRWLSAAHRSVLTGFERHLPLHCVTFASAILRFPCIVLWFSVVTPSATNYFIWQLLVSVLELLTLFMLSRAAFQPTRGIKPWNAIKSLGHITGFAVQQFLVSMLRILITQSDKLLLSRLLPLATFGYVTLAAAAAAGVHLIVLPVNQVLMPKLARLVALEKYSEVTSLYRLATRATMVPVTAIAGTFGFFSTEVMLAWTGEPHIAELTAPALAGYGVGNASMAAAGFAYYLQYAYGRMKTYNLGMVAMLLVLVPTLYWATMQFGVKGAATVWAVSWTLYLMTWTVWIQRLFLPDDWRQWIMLDVLRPAGAVVVIGAIIQYHNYWPESRPLLIVALIAKCLILMLVAAIASGFATRNPFVQKPRARQN